MHLCFQRSVGGLDWEGCAQQSPCAPVQQLVLDGLGSAVPYSSPDLLPPKLLALSGWRRVTCSIEQWCKFTPAARPTGSQEQDMQKSSGS